MSAVQVLASFYAAHSNLINQIGINALLALSVWVTLACGQLSLGNMGFMAIAAYTSVLLVLRAHWPFAGAVLAGCALAALAGLLLGWPVLRLRGVFLAIATLGFGEIVRIAAVNLDVTGGAEGISGIPPWTKTWLIYVSLAAAVFLLWRLTKTRAGRAFDAIAQDEVAAEGVGINAAAYKLLAFAIGAFIAGYAGALSAFSTYFISPSDYGFTRVIDMLAYAVAGGTGSVGGPVLGAALLTMLPEALRVLHGYRDIANGAILLLVIIFMPQGLWSLIPRRRAASSAGVVGPERSSGFSA